jgi:hypothetical protein
LKKIWPFYKKRLASEITFCYVDFHIGDPHGKGHISIPSPAIGSSGYPIH